jgi:hypothetical protein
VERPDGQAIDLTSRLRRAQEALAVIAAQPRDRPLRLSLARARNILPAEIVNLCLVLEIVEQMAFPAVSLEPPEPSFLGVYLWRIGLFDCFPQYAPPPPRRGRFARDNDRLIELRHFTDLAGIWELRERLPGVLTAAAGADDLPGGAATQRRLANTVYELAENAVAHSRRLSPGAPVSGYYLVQRMPRRRQTFLAVGDAGHGIPATMQARYPELADDLEALREALRPGVSGSDGGGNGLALAHESAAAIPGGVMTIESGAAWLRARGDGTQEAERYPVTQPLTRVSFKFDV